MIKFVTPIVLIFLLINNFIGDIKTAYEGYGLKYQWIGGWGMLIAVAVVVIVLTSIKSKETVDIGEGTDL